MTTMTMMLIDAWLLMDEAFAMTKKTTTTAMMIMIVEIEDGDMQMHGRQARGVT